MTQQSNEPALEANRFDLTGKGHGSTRIIYVEGDASTSHTPELSYRDEERKLSFSDAQISSQEETGIGRMLTVTLEAVPDSHTLTLTLLLPHVNLMEGAESPVEALAILTTHKSSIAGPRLVKGTLEAYRALALRGTASYSGLVR